MFLWQYNNLDPENPNQSIKEQQLKKFYRNQLEKEWQHKLRMNNVPKPKHDERKFKELD